MLNKNQLPGVVAPCADEDRDLVTSLMMRAFLRTELSVEVVAAALYGANYPQVSVN